MPVIASDHLQNPSNPFFLHLSENPILVLVSPILDGKNCHTWLWAMEMALDSKNKVEFVDRLILMLPQVDPMYQSGRDAKLCQISDHVDGSLTTYFKSLRTSCIIRKAI